jgi:hypothetical protein
MAVPRGRAEGQGDQPPDSLGAEELQDDHAGHDGQAGDEMRLKADGQGDQRDDQRRCHSPKGHDKTCPHLPKFSF